jgi:UDP-N-acetylmuramate dehydrogenase
MAAPLHAGAARIAPGAVSLARRTTFRIGGTARECYQPATLDELGSVLETLGAERRRPFVLGGGANTLFPDGEFLGPIISTEKLRRIEVEGSSIFAECGARLNLLIQTGLRAGLAGLEGFVGIPGTAGGAVLMNAGGSGWSFGERVLELGLYPIGGGPLVRARGSDVRWAYRRADLGDHVVAWVRLGLVPGDAGRMKRSARDFMVRKARTQPLDEASAGCIFKNPLGGSAARLIDELGLKGLRRGGAEVSTIHANFIVNADGRATAGDVLGLIEDVRARVAEARGVLLETEIVLPRPAAPGEARS